MSNVIVIMFFTGIILIYIDMKLEAPRKEKDENNEEEKELHKRITERYSGSADIFTPMFNTKIDELWLSSK